MFLSRKRIALAFVSSVAAGVLLPATASYAAEAPAPQPRPAAVQGAVPGEAGALAGKVDVASAVLDITQKIMNIVTEAIERKQNRSGYVKSLMEGAFYESGQRYNVMVINDANGHTAHLNGIVYDARVSGIHGKYRVIVFESGQFTNHGDGGWINWAFRGWFDRDGGHVNFRRSW
ncbi:stress protein [Streptomyces globosus]|uniref:Stress protein n=1 Tax=Streptomyces globosus TaxID=68209 RepID=A0A344U053_9ACTN|nr:stress protein [Streptomyces globosus]AXE24274.1 stress protein [Streptomyces globosus]